MATVALSVYAHGLSAQPLTRRYVRWFEGREQPAMESAGPASESGGRVKS